MDKMKTLHELVCENAQRFELPPDIIKSIIYKESNGNVFAGRYEKGFFSKYLDGKTLEKLGGHIPSTITKDTEYMLRATSFGFMQIMGQVARERGFALESLIEVCKPELNIYYGCKHFKYLLNMKGGDIEKALLNYNGGGDPEYGKDIIAINNSRRFNKIDWNVTGY